MGPGEHRPHDEEYWQRPWSRALFAGDLFEAIPFGDQPTVLTHPSRTARDRPRDSPASSRLTRNPRPPKCRFSKSLFPVCSP